MKKLFYILCIFFAISCEKDEPSPPISPSFEDRFISQTIGRDGLSFLYQEGLPVKVLILGFGDQNYYDKAIEIEYNENNRVQRMIIDPEGQYPIEDGFNFHLDPESPDYYRCTFIYEDERLVQINNSGGDKIFELKYDIFGRVTHKIHSNTYIPWEKTWVKTFYFYNDNGELIGYKIEDALTGTREVKISTDDKANPFYVLWDKYSFVFPNLFYNQIYRHNVPFFPHNVTQEFEENELLYQFSFLYEDDYPINYFVEIANGIRWEDQLSPSLDLSIYYEE